jgi:recombinational DNA repair ATPase RecF
MELAVVVMRLPSVTADNVLSMEHASFEPDDTLTVIVGLNGVGKSNIVLVAGFDLAVSSIPERLEALGVVFTDAEHVIDAVLASAEDVRWLDARAPLHHRPVRP